MFSSLFDLAFSFHSKNSEGQSLIGAVLCFDWLAHLWLELLLIFLLRFHQLYPAFCHY